MDKYQTLFDLKKSSLLEIGKEDGGLIEPVRIMAESEKR
jgi:hypothetical protein